ncbi:MAG: GtrA family protein [Roseiarcus sp.]|jgi:putative flippase GtrA
MSQSGTQGAAARKALARQFVAFLAIGGFGFCIDAALTILLVRGFGVDPLFARLPAFAIVTLINFALNRAFTFGAGGTHWREALARYVLVCLGGLAVNYVVYAACLAAAAGFDVALSSAVLTLCVGCGTGAAALVTFAGFRSFAFRQAKALEPAQEKAAAASAQSVTPA